MKTRSSVIALLTLLPILFGAGCVDGNVSRRDDGNYPIVQRDSSAVRVKEVLLSNPKLTPKEAYDLADAETSRQNAAADAAYFKKRKQKEEREDFIKELAATDK